ncbi:hypothetical protein MMC28_011687, partial [Mycoblastus sanguinarius]|nr:hypothetical protein [Mycoblastus sanguinarius]
VPWINEYPSTFYHTNHNLYATVTPPLSSLTSASAIHTIPSVKCTIANLCTNPSVAIFVANPLSTHSVSLYVKGATGWPTGEIPSSTAPDAIWIWLPAMGPSPCKAMWSVIAWPALKRQARTSSSDSSGSRCSGTKLRVMGVPGTG